ncbi:MAG: BTAD domain-containing putative transcriptional regulator [Brevefilum sp.]|nr:BTAD domain-containing putative transcriptional regulator [Brevefilum sp.]
MNQLNVRLFGSMQLMRGDQPLSNFGSNKVRALFAYLVVESNCLHQRRKLGSLLWPEVPETTALSNLRYALSNLRKVLGDRTAQPPYLLITPQTVQYNPRCHYHLDAAEFEAQSELSRQNPLDFVSLMNAADLYRGRFMEGFSIPDSIPFEEWMVLKRERFNRMAYEVLNRLARYYELIGEYGQAIGCAQRQIELDPWREEVHRLIMRCLYFSGQRSAAIAQYESCCNALTEDLDISPSPDTVNLYKAICEETLSAPPTPPAFFLRAPVSPVERSHFVSRQVPLSRMSGALNQALEGHGGLLLVTGGPGQGKTALVQEFIRGMLETYPQVAAAWGNSHAYFGSGDPFLPFREILEMLSGQVEHRWEAGAISHDHARRLWHLTELCTQALIQQGPELIGTFVPGTSLLQRVSYVLREEPAWLSQLSKLVDQKSESHPITREDLIQQYGRVLSEISHHVPLLIFVDDLQWADQSSLDLFFHLSRQLSNTHILLVGAFRPVQSTLSVDAASLSLADMINELRLQCGDVLIDLDEITDRGFIDAYLDQEPNQLGDDFRDDLYYYTHSHPLYTVEMLFDMKQRGNLIKNEAGVWMVSESLDWDHLPSRIEAAIEERLCHLPDDLLHLLKTASVEGERFTAEVLADILKIAEEDVLTSIREELDHQFRLVQADSSQRIDGERLSRYRFRHILFQKYLYDHLDTIERVELHEAVGKAMEERYVGEMEEIAVQLAIHFELAGLDDKAITYYDLAGRRAIEFSSYEDAINHFKKALSLLEKKPMSMDRDRREFDLLLGMSAPLMFAHGFASEDMRLINDRMAALLKRIPLDLEMFPVFHAIGAYYQMRGQYKQAHALMQGAELLARRSEDELLIRVVNWAYGFNFLWLGKLEEALFHLQKMVDFYDPHVHGEFRKSFGMDAGVASCLWSSWTLWMLGFPEKALNRGQQAIDLGFFLNDPGNLSFAQDLTGFLRLLIRETDEVDELLESLGKLLEKNPMQLHYADFEFLSGFYDVQKGASKTGISRMCKGIEAFQACGTISQLSMRLTILAEAYLEDGQWGLAAQAIQDAEALIEDLEERFYKAEALRVKGKLMQNTGATKEAEISYLEAMRIAGEQKAKTFELRAATDLARLWEKQGRFEEANQTLGEVYNWFTEGFETADLKESQALLKELGKYL